MTTETLIPGKDASLESTIHTMQTRLSALGFHIEERSWLNPVDGIWSVHVRDRDCPLMFTNGKGATEKACLASALGEYFERLSTNYFWTHFYLGRAVAEGDFVHYPQEKWFPLPEDGQWPAGILNPDLHAFYNPGGDIDPSNLVEFNSGNPERGICTIPYTRLSDGEVAYVPVNIIGNLYVSNGMSAGNTMMEARTQAFSEIFERHIKGRIIAEGICLPDVPEHVIARWPRIASGIKALREAGFGILIKDASLGGQYPVMNVTLLHPDDQGCFASFGAHPRFEVALERALTELLQGRALDALAGFPMPGFDMDEVASATNIEIHFVDSSGVIHWNFLGDRPDHAFVDWNFANSTAQDYEWALNRLHQDGFEVYVADFTHLGVYACRVLVPGASEIYPVDDIEFENNSVGNHMREALLNLGDLDDEECSELLESLNESAIPDTRALAAVIGMAPDAGTFWADIRVGELKALLALACGDGDAAIEGCEWVRHFAQLNPERRRVYACCENLLRLAQSDVGIPCDTRPFHAALALLHSKETLAKAHELVSQKNRFMGLSSPGLEMTGCVMYGKLLEAYAKVQMHKTALAMSA